MNASDVVFLLVGLLVGLGVGVVAARQVAAARRRAQAAEDVSAIAQARAEAAQARSELSAAKNEAAVARAETASARGETAQVRAEVAGHQTVAAQARGEAADARAETALALAEAAREAAKVAKAVAERDAAEQRARELTADRESLVVQFKALSAETLEHQGKRADASADARLKSTELLMAPVQESLRLFNERLTEVEKERVAMATELREQVKNVQFTGESLRRETSALVTALRKPQVRGAWGEMQLKRVAEVAGMVERCDFDLQLTATANERTLRPDMRVNLADGKFLYVDSKVPLSAFLDAHSTEDEAERAAHLAVYGKNVRTHIDQLSGKQYWKLETSSPEFVILFLPNESFLAAALEQLPDLYEYAARRDIIIATPTTLIATLRTAGYAWKQAALAESAAQVFTLGRELYERLGRMGGEFDKVGRSLGTAVKAYNASIGSLESRVMVSARRFRDLKVTEAELIEAKACEESVRQITAPELVESAAAVEPLIGRTQRALEASPTTPAEQLPEGAQLVREQPALEALLGEAHVEPSPAGRRRRTG